MEGFIRKFFVFLNVVSLISIVLCIIVALIGTTSQDNNRKLHQNAVEAIQQERLKKLSLEGSIETKHFIICYSPAEVELSTVVQIAKYAEAAYDPVKEKLQSQHQQKIYIILKELKTVFEDADYTTAGYASAGMIYLPPVIQENTQGTVIHEVTHVIIGDITAGNCPLWLNEGIAVFMDEFFSKVVYRSEKSDLRLNKPYNMAELEDFKSTANKALAYRQSSMIVRYILETHGIEKLLQILNDLYCREYSLPQIINNRLNMDYETFEQKALKWIVENEY